MISSPPPPPPPPPPIITKVIYLMVVVTLQKKKELSLWPWSWTKQSRFSTRHLAYVVPFSSRIFWGSPGVWCMGRDYFSLTLPMLGLLCPLTPLQDKDHTQWVTEVLIQCVWEDNAREGRTLSEENHGAAEEGCRTREKGQELNYTPQGFQTRTGLYYNYDYWL